MHLRRLDISPHEFCDFTEPCSAQRAGSTTQRRRGEDGADGGHRDTGQCSPRYNRQSERRGLGADSMEPTLPQRTLGMHVPPGIFSDYRGERQWDTPRCSQGPGTATRRAWLAEPPQTAQKSLPSARQTRHPPRRPSGRAAMEARACPWEGLSMYKSRDVGNTSLTVNTMPFHAFLRSCFRPGTLSWDVLGRGRSHTLFTLRG